MSNPYSEETRRILADFLRALEENAEIDRRFLQIVKRMTETGKLGSGRDIQQALELLEGQEDEH